MIVCKNKGPLRTAAVGVILDTKQAAGFQIEIGNIFNDVTLGDNLYIFLDCVETKVKL